MNDKEIILSRIRKLFAIATDSTASDNEVLEATKKAQKLIYKHKISESEIEVVKESIEDVVHIVLENRCTGYFHMILQQIARKNRCEAFYSGRYSSNNCVHKICGLKKDTELITDLSNQLMNFVVKRIPQVQKQYKGCSSAIELKKSYIIGFAESVKKCLNESIKELQNESNIDCDKFEMMLVNTPVVVNQYISTKLRPKVIKHKPTMIEEQTYNQGVEDGKSFMKSKTT